MALLQLLGAVLIASSVLGERPPPAHELISNCQDEFLEPCPNYAGLKNCLETIKDHLRNFPDEVTEVKDAIKNVREEPDICPSLTVEKTCYQEHFKRTTTMFNQYKAILDFPGACSHLKDAIARLVELKAVCKADLPGMSATAKIAEYNKLKNDNCS